MRTPARAARRHCAGAACFRPDHRRQADAHPPDHARSTSNRPTSTHDGHLTLDQAKTGYKSVARHFAAIDQDKKGYITEDDIRAYNKTQRALHHQSASRADTPNS